MAVPLTLDEPVVDPTLAADRRRMMYIYAGRIIVSVGFLVVWQAMGSHLDTMVLSTPAHIASRLWEWTLDGTLWRNLLVTAEEVLLGYITGAGSAVVLGLLLGSYPTIAGVLDPILMAIYGVPKIAFGPLFIVWFGIGLAPKVVVTALMVFFFVFFSTYEGARRIDRDLIRVVTLMGASSWQERAYVIIPGSMPAIFLGLKLAIPEALVGAIVGELIVSNRGIGYLVQYSAGQLDATGIFAALFTLMVLTLLANSAVNYATGKTGRVQT